MARPTTTISDARGWIIPDIFGGQKLPLKAHGVEHVANGGSKQVFTDEAE